MKKSSRSILFTFIGRFFIASSGIASSTEQGRKSGRGNLVIRYFSNIKTLEILIKHSYDYFRKKNYTI